MTEISIFTFLGGIFGLRLYEYLTLQYNYNQLFAETVSKSRMEWIDNFRDELGTVLGTATFSYMFMSNVDRMKVLVEAEKARVKLLTRLNQDTSKSGNEYNHVFAECLQKVDLSGSSCLRQADYDKMIELARKILEPEWQRVKREAKGEEKN